MIRVVDLTKDFGSRRAIESLTFHAKKGEILGFLGPNGAGKTTTMRILTGYMPPSYGKAEIGGYDVVDQSLEVRKIVGYLPENVPLYPDLTVYDFLKYMADLRQIKNADDRIEEILELTKMDARADSYIGKLSKGMRQRIGIAQALLHEPEILVLDEPTIGLDPAQIIEIRNVIRSVGKERTVLLSTHILSEAQQVCDRVIIINKGRIIAEDSPQQLQARIAGSQRIVMQVRSDSESVKPVIEQVKGVSNISLLGDGRVEFESQPGTDIRPEIVRQTVRAGLDLLDIHLSNLSLEEIFLQLTKDDISTDSPEPIGTNEM